MQYLSQKIQQFKWSKKHLSKHKEIKFKDILKYQRQAEADFNPKNILVFPMNVQDINGPFRMLREAKAECLLIEGNENCFGIFLNFKLILTRYLNNYYSNEGTFILFEHLGTLVLYYCWLV